MKITKQRLKEIIKEELEAPEEDLATCKPETEIFSLGEQLGELIVSSVFEKEVYGDIVDYAMMYVAERTPGMETSEEEEIEIPDRGREYGDYSNLGIKETIRRMVRETLGSLSEPEEEYPKNWVIHKHGVTDDKSYLTKDLRRNPWGSLEQAERHEFKEMAKGVRLAATRLAADGPYIIDGIEHADIVDLSEPEEPEEDSDDPGLELSAPTAQQLTDLGFNPYK
jgi:hypothetical protein